MLATLIPLSGIPLSGDCDTAASSVAAVARCAVPGLQVIFRTGLRRAFAVFGMMIGVATHVGISALRRARFTAQSAFLPCGFGGGWFGCGHLAFLAYALELVA